MKNRPVALLSIVLAVPTAADAIPVVVWDDPAFVDSSGGAGAESDEIQATLVALGHTVTTFTGTSSAAWTAALAGANVLVIPETEPSGGTFSALNLGGGASQLSAFVADGGGLITSYDLASLAPSDSILNGVFGLNLGASGISTSTLDNAAAAGTAFAGGPSFLNPYSATVGYSVSAVAAAGGTSIYREGGLASVALFTHGAGEIAALGWDWFSSAIPGPGSQDGDGRWASVLDRAVQQVQRPVQVPEPATLALLGIGLAALGAARRSRRS